MDFETLTETEPTTITGVAFVSVYVDNFKEAFNFYTGLLDLTVQYEMGEEACFFAVGAESGLYLEGGHRYHQVDPLTSRSTFTLAVPSASALFEKLHSAGVRMIDKAPRKVGEGRYWFQFLDTSGNIIEAFGEE